MASFFLYKKKRKTFENENEWLFRFGIIKKEIRAITRDLSRKSANYFSKKSLDKIQA
jgi:hypothetical protein